MGQMIGEILKDSLAVEHSQRYQIKSLIGKQRGRRTFLAENVETKAPVVLKLILFGPDFTWEDLKLFEREAETLKSLDHAAIPKYLDSFEVETALGKGFVLVQTYIEARSLQEQMTSGRRFSEMDLKELAQSILVILQYLHSRHPAVVHRDIKPSNVLLSDRTAHSPGKVYLVDFGSVQVAHHGGTITVVGTYGYMPPEQFGGRATPASDLYSLGATLVYLATGQHPADFAEESLEDAISTHLTLSNHFKQWIRDLVRPNAAQRTPSAALAFHNLNHSQPAQRSLQASTEPKRVESAEQITTAVESSLAPQKAASSIANGAFRVQSTAQTLAIQFHKHRIKERIKLQTFEENSKHPDPAQLSFVAVLGIITFMATLIVAASGLMAGLALLFSCFFISIVVYLLTKFSSGSDTDPPRTAITTLTKAPDDSIYLTVEVLQLVTKKGDHPGKVMRSLIPTQFTSKRLQTVRIVPYALDCHACFAFSEDQQGWHSGLKISGSQREIESLIRYIREWDNSIVEPEGGLFMQQRLR